MTVKMQERRLVWGTHLRCFEVWGRRYAPRGKANYNTSYL